MRKGITIYSKEKCMFCTKSKSLLSLKKIPYTEVKLDPEENMYIKTRDELVNVSKGHKTFPWIFLGEDFLGGFKELNHSFCIGSISPKLKTIGINYKEDYSDF